MTLVAHLLAQAVQPEHVVQAPLQALAHPLQLLTHLILLLVPGADWLRWPLCAWAAAFFFHGLLARGFAWYGTGWFAPQWGDEKMGEMYHRLSRKRRRRVPG